MSRGKLVNHIESILSKKHLLTAVEILDELSSRGFDYNKTSVYRALEKMLKEEIICRQGLGTPEIYYELRNDSHDHMICTKCSKLSKISEIKLPDDLGGFTVEHHHLTVYGICADCQQLGLPDISKEQIIP